MAKSVGWKKADLGDQLHRARHLGHRAAQAGQRPLTGHAASCSEARKGCSETNVTLPGPYYRERYNKDPNPELPKSIGHLLALDSDGAAGTAGAAGAAGAAGTAAGSAA